VSTSTTIILHALLILVVAGGLAAAIAAPFAIARSEAERRLRAAPVSRATDAPAVGSQRRAA